MSITKPILTLCLVTKQDIYAQTSACFTNIAMTSFENYQVSTQYCIGQSDLPKARSIQSSQWYDKASFGDVFMFIDSDQTFTKADIETSLHYLKQADVVCGAYCRRDGTMTLQPKDPVSFYQNKEGEIWFGATGFMMISYNILHRIASESKKVIVSRNSDSTSHTFFLERIVTEPDLGIENMWLGEDFSFCWLARQHGAKVMGYISPTIGHILSGERFVSIPKYETWEKNTITIYCGNTAEPWSPNKLKSGLGGSELAIIYLTKYWALKGYSVTVYCNCDKPGLYEGVKYNDITTFNPLDHFHILIGWRALHLFNFVDIQATKCVADLHDIIKPSQLTPQIIKRTDVFFVKSKYHASMLKDVPKEKIMVLPNGGYVPYTGTEKDKNYVIYSSSYDRGIAYILKWAWPKIKQACPDAYLKIFYGWNGFDATLPKTDDIKLYKDTIVELMKQDGVMECGRISQQELLKEKAKANIHLYTGDFQEIDCISIRESAGLKVIPVVSKYQHVFEEKSYCQCIEGDPLTQEMQERVAEVVIKLINDEKYCEEVRNNMQLPVSETWENVADLWLEKLFQKENKIVETKEVVSVCCSNDSNKIVDKINQDLRVETKQINLKTKCVCTYKKNNLILEEWFVNDKLHRDNDLPASIAYYESKDEKEKLCKLEIWYQNGEIKRNYEYSMKPEASPCWIEYYENGNVKEKRWYKNGLLGKDQKFWDDKPDVIQYYENGNEKRVEYHENGILCRDCAPSVIEYYESGQKKMEENHYRNKEDSTEHKHMVTEFYPKNNYEFNDKKKSQRWFVNDRLANNEEDVPASVEYYENGNVKNEAWYKEGKLHREGNHPAFIEYFPSSSLKSKGNRKQERWYKEGELHNDEDFESVIDYGDLGRLRSVWYKCGKKHRGNGDPAEIIYNNLGDKLEERWFVDGLLSRENGKPVTVYYSELNNKIKQDPIEEIDENELQIVSTEILDYKRSNDITIDLITQEDIKRRRQIELKVKNGDYTEETKYSSNNVRCVKIFKKFNLIVEEWFAMERRHRSRNKKLGETLPAFIEYYEQADEKASNSILKKQEWYKNGYLHRENGPAIVEYYDNFFPCLKSRECWYKYGTLEKNEKGELMIVKYYEDGRIVT